MVLNIINESYLHRIIVFGDPWYQICVPQLQQLTELLNMLISHLYTFLWNCFSFFPPQISHFLNNNCLKTAFYKAGTHFSLRSQKQTNLCILFVSRCKSPTFTTCKWVCGNWNKISQKYLVTKNCAVKSKIRETRPALIAKSNPIHMSLRLEKDILNENHAQSLKSFVVAQNLVGQCTCKSSLGLYFTPFILHSVISVRGVQVMSSAGKPALFSARRRQSAILCFSVVISHRYSRTENVRIHFHHISLTTVVENWLLWTESLPKIKNSRS